VLLPCGKPECSVLPRHVQRYTTEYLAKRKGKYEILCV
jgi:hypothetical protein